MDTDIAVVGVSSPTLMNDFLYSVMFVKHLAEQIASALQNVCNRVKADAKAVEGEDGLR